MNYKSTEERVFAAWLDEAMHKGIVESYMYEPETFKLIDKILRPSEDKKKYGQLVEYWSGMSYTPDFRVCFKENVFNVPFVLDDGKVFLSNEYSKDVFLEIKGTNTRFPKRDLPIRLGLMIHKYNKFVKVIRVPDDLPWMPEKLPPECYNKDGTIAKKWRR